MNEKKTMRLVGAAAGALNGLFGSGGGAAAVPLLQKAGLSVKESHASSISLTLPFSAVSAVIYSMEHDIDLSEAVRLIPFGLAGALCGAFFLKRISPKLLTGIFGVILVSAGVRLLFI